MTDLFGNSDSVELAPFPQWLDQLADAFASLADMSKDEAANMIDGCGQECWREMYDEGYSPRDAAREEMSNWDGDGDEAGENASADNGTR